MQIFVTTLAGKTTPFDDVEPGFLIENLRELIHEKMKIPPPAQRLFVGPAELQNGHTLNDYNIRNESTIVLRTRIIGATTANSEETN